MDGTVIGQLSMRPATAAAIEQRLNAAIETKIAQRRSANYRNYDIPRETVRRIEVNGHPGLTPVAQFDIGGGKPRVKESVSSRRFDFRRACGVSVRLAANAVSPPSRCATSFTQDHAALSDPEDREVRVPADPSQPSFPPR